MKALSVRAPWSWAILHGKPVENRDWYTNVRGTVWLHESKWWSKRGIEDDLEDIEIMAARDGLSIPICNCAALHASRGCIVGSIEIIDCVKFHPSAFFVGKFGFVLRNPVWLQRPIPFKGSLGFFEVPDHMIGDSSI